MVSFLRDKRVPLAVFVTTFLIACFGTYFDIPGLPVVYSGLFDWVLIMTTFALGVGVISLIIYHSRRIAKKEKRYPMSFVVFAAIIIMTFACFYSIDTRDLLYGNIYTALATAVLGFTSFVQYTALFRAFRVRNTDALIFAVAALMAIMLYAPIFEYISPFSAQIGNWIMEVPSSGTNKGIIIGVAIGTIALAIRSVTGKETGYMAE
jgi:hypothetical protein